MNVVPRKPGRLRFIGLRSRARMLPIAAMCLALTAPVCADSWRDLPLEHALRRLAEQGLNILYSSDLVRPAMRVREEPQAGEARLVLEEVVRPYGLVVRDGPNGLLMLVRREQPRALARVLNAVSGTSHHATPDLEEVIVSASQYELMREPAVAPAFISAADLQAIPNLGDDPLRAAARLPGVASGEFSAKVNVRGGHTDETLVRFDGLRLENPFHLKDFQSTFSIVGPSVVDGMRIHSGGFPVTFGDRMSGVIDIDPLSPQESAYQELALSFFNASALTAGRTDDGRNEWLFSARRGNLDLLVDAVNSSIGQPGYRDFYGHMGRHIGTSWMLSANALVSDDTIVLFDSDREEQARAEYRDAYYWLRLDYSSSDWLAGSTLLARGEIDSDRRGSADQEGIARGELVDVRAFSIASLQSDWSARLRPNLLVQFGGEWRGMRGRYHYDDHVELDLLVRTPGAARALERERNINVRPEADHYGVYANLRLEPAASVTVDAGLRWDQQSTSPGIGNAISPRISLLYSFGERTHLRTSWGRYYQAQSITELQVSDGVTEFWSPQRADHLITSLQYDLSPEVHLRLEAYHKDYRQVRPRFENLLNTFVLLPELKPDRVRIAPDRARATGVELTLRRDAGQPLSWWVSYAWSSAKDRVDGSQIARSWDQEHSFNGGLMWNNGRWELSLFGTYHSGWPTSELALVQTEPVAIATVVSRNRTRLEDYRSLDARIARVFDLKSAGTLTLFLEINNALDRRNECCVEYELESEDEATRLDLSRRPYLPITPSVGMIWRF